MENRFGIKDFFLFTLIFVVIVLIVLAMVQVDRQWKSIQALQENSRQQGRDLVEIKRTLAEGISVTSPTTKQAGAPDAKGTDPFKPIKDSEAMPGFARGDWLIDNFGTKLKAITPYIGNDVYAAWVQQKVGEGLIYRDVDSLDWVPMLAKSWTISPDGKTIQFQLRRGISFSDGEPFTADDVVFTFDWIRNPQVNAPRERSGLDLMKEVKKVDDFTVEFTFKEFFFKSLETVGSQPVLPKHFYSKYTPDQFNETPGLLMGTGPYRLEDPAGWKPGDRMMLVRNDRYWGTPPAPDRLVWAEVEEETAEQTMFTNGELDIFGATAEQFVKMKDDPKVLAKGKPMEYVNMLAGYGYISWNEVIGDKPSVFADKRVRQALTMLIDRESMVRDVFLGYASVANGPFAPGSKQADPSVKPWPYDPERAKKLLAECGFVDKDGDGVLEKPDGTPFRFKLTFPNKQGVYERMTLFMKDGLAKAGVVMERDPIEWPLLLQRMDKCEFDAIMLGWSGAIDDDPYQMFHSSQIKDQGDNRMSYKSQELDDTIVAARTCVDEAKRLELWHKVHRILAEDCPYTFLLNRKSTVLFNNRWQNIRRSTIGTNYNRLDFSPLPWFVPTAQQKYTK
jgi:peptide/nickel transport system substrate-binding protein